MATRRPPFLLRGHYGKDPPARGANRSHTIGDPAQQAALGII